MVTYSSAPDQEDRWHSGEVKREGGVIVAVKTKIERMSYDKP